MELNKTYYLSLGAGVQSSALALMLDSRYIDYPKPEFAIFADTQAEPPKVCGLDFHAAIFEDDKWTTEKYPMEAI